MLYRHLNNLGFKAKHKHMAIEGVITSLRFDVNGKVYYSITSNFDKHISVQWSNWIDQSEIVVDTDSGPVMDIPSFELTKCPDDNGIHH